MLNFTVIKLSLFLLVGIVLGFYLEFPIEALIPWLILLFLIFTFSYFRARKNLLKDSFFGLCTFTLFFFLGIFSTSVHLPENQPKHYSHHILTTGTEQILIAEVIEKLKPGAYQEKFIARAREISGKKVTGKFLLNFSADSTEKSFQIGDKIALSPQLIPINKPLNPHQFDYSKYMESLRVLHQTSLSKEEILKLEEKNTNLQSIAGAIRGRIVNKLQESNLSVEELAIIQALLLGQRQDISKEVYEHYAAAGVIHILAVSGLHVGIILLILSRLLSPLERVKNGKLIKLLLLLFLLWSFAVIAGLSPSVVRAVTMFSFVAVGMQMNRPTNVLNTLFASLLLLLLINPYFVLQVGFQLSYAAVFSIVLIQPHLYKLFEPENRIIKYLWGIFTVTIAAQVGVLPLSLYYFHQFPGLFFISNLVILPFLGIILGLGLLVSLLAAVDLLPKFLSTIYGNMISALNNFVEWTASKEEFLFENIYFSLTLCISLYLVIFGIILLLRKISFPKLVFVLMSIIVVQVAFFYEKNTSGNSLAIIFHKSRNSLLGFKEGNQVKIYHDLDSAEASPVFLRTFQTNENIRKYKELPLQNIYEFRKKKILIIDSSGLYKIPGLQPEIILLKNSPRINLERVILELNPELIVADGSNYRSLLTKWKESAAKEKVPFHATGEKGAFIIKHPD